MRSQRFDRFAWITVAPILAWAFLWVRHTSPDVLWLDRRLGWWGFFVAPLGVYVAHVAFHELGHVIGAAFAGFRVDHIGVSKLSLNVGRDGAWFLFDLRSSARWSTGWVSGDCQQVTNLPARLAVVCAGGPIASLVFAGSCAWLMWTQRPAPGLAAFGCLLALGIVGWLRGLNTRDQYANDFQQLRGCLRREPQLLRLYRLRAVSNAVVRGGDLAATKITREELEDLMAWDPTCWARLAACVWAAQAGDFALALAWAQGRNHEPPPPPRGPNDEPLLRSLDIFYAVAQLEAAYLARLGRPADARRQLDALEAAATLVHGNTKNLDDVAAAVLWSEGRHAAAHERWAAWERRAEERIAWAAFDQTVTGWIGTWIGEAAKLPNANGLPEVPRA